MRYTHHVTEKPFQPLQLGKYVLFRHLPARRVGADTFLARQSDDEAIVEYHLFDKALSKHMGIQKRLHQECKIINSLEHPNVLKILDFGLIKERFYYTTPSRNAMSLRALRDGMDGQLDQEQVLTLATPLASALEYIHAHHVFHRGIDLHSIYVDLDDNVPYMADFSLAKSSDFANLTELGVPRTRKIQVTPEAVFKLPYDERTDIYLFGVVLYSLLTGEDPNTLDAIRARSEEGKPNFQLIPVSDTLIGCERNLSYLIEQLVEPEPKNRIQTSKEVSRQFRRLAEKKRVHDIISQMKTDVMASQTGLIVKSLVDKAERKKKEDQATGKGSRKKVRSKAIRRSKPIRIGGGSTSLPEVGFWGVWPFVGLGSILIILAIISFSWRDPELLRPPTKPTKRPTGRIPVKGLKKDEALEFRKMQDEFLALAAVVSKRKNLTTRDNCRSRITMFSKMVSYCERAKRKFPMKAVEIQELSYFLERDIDQARKKVDRLLSRLFNNLPYKMRKKLLADLKKKTTP